MTGTATPRPTKFQQIYGLEVVVIPTHRPMIRDDKTPTRSTGPRRKVRRSSTTSRTAIRRGQPVLVGTTSIEVSEAAEPNSCRPKRSRTEVLNAAARARSTSSPRPGRQARSPSPPTWPGRGTDIQLGGNADAASPRTWEAQGEVDEAAARDPRRMAAAPRAGAGRRRPAHRRHRAPRIPPHRQPAARPFRPPGRPGLLRFYLSLEDNLMRIFAADWVQKVMADGPEGRRHHRVAAGHRRSPTRSARSRPTTSTSARTCSTSTTSTTTSAR